MILPVKSVTLPHDLKNQANGKLDANLLLPVDGGHMHHLAAKHFTSLAFAAKKAGFILKPTSEVDTYRNYAVQLTTFFKRYDNTKRATRTEKFENKQWWLKPGVAGAAVPGTSNHGWGLAIDIAHVTPAMLEWLVKHADAYGFSWESQSENWHIRYYKGD